VEAHGGTVEANSPGEGKGSTFTVRLPIRAVGIREAGEEEKVTSTTGEGEPEDVAPVIASRPLVRLDGLRVLVVDDEADARRVLVLVLEQVGAIVTAAGSEAEIDRARNVAVVNETFVRRYLPGEDPIGRRVRLAGPGGPLRVLGTTRGSTSSAWWRTC
jgi:MacB-like periplasmic core domain